MRDIPDAAFDFMAKRFCLALARAEQSEELLCKIQVAVERMVNLGMKDKITNTVTVAGEPWDELLDLVGYKKR